MPISTLIKEGAFDADLRNAINTNFSDTVTLDTTQTVTGNKSTASGTFILASFANGIVATGNAGNGQNYNNGVNLVAEINSITTANANNNSAILPASQAGMELVVMNANASVAVSVFPTKGEHINFAANNAAIVVGNNNVCEFWCPVAGTWLASQAALA